MTGKQDENSMELRHCPNRSIKIKMSFGTYIHDDNCKMISRPSDFDSRNPHLYWKRVQHSLGYQLCAVVGLRSENWFQYMEYGTAPFICSFNEYTRKPLDQIGSSTAWESLRADMIPTSLGDDWMPGDYKAQSWCFLGLLLPTWINFNPSMDRWLHLL